MRSSGISKQKRLPRAGHARESDRATHQLDELLGDGKAETGSAEAAADRDIGLGEFLEQRRLRRLIDADAGIRHLETHDRLIAELARHG